MDNAQIDSASDRAATFRDLVTHFITDTIHCEYATWCRHMEYDDVAVSEENSPVAVTPAWVERSIALRHLQPTKLYSPNPRDIFSGIVICCAHLTPHDADVMATSVTSMGGGIKQTLCEEVTHVVAIDRDNSKMRALEQHKTDLPIIAVAPHWINDSFSVQRLLPLDKYIFPMDKPQGLPPCLCAPQTDAQATVVSLSLPPQTSNTEHSVLKGKTVLFARDIHGGTLEARPELHSIRDRVVQVGGRCASTIPATASADEVAAAIERVDVIVARHRESDECTHALGQQKTVGTLPWLAKVLSTGHITSPRDRLLHFPYPYEHVQGFPKLSITITNYKGQARAYLKELIVKMGGVFTPELSTMNDVCVALDLHGDKVKRAREWNIPIVNHIWLENCFATWTNQHLAQRSFITFPGAAQLSAVLGQVGVTDESVSPYIHARPKIPPAVDMSQPTPPPEDVSPVASPPANAQDSLQPEVPQPEPEQPEHMQPEPEPTEAQPSEYIEPKERGDDEPSSPTALRHKREAPAAPRTPKRARKELLVATTSVALTKTEQHALEALGIQYTERISEAHVLVAKGLTRTEKMLCAIAKGLDIVSVSWIKTMIRKRERIDPKAYVLQDRTRELQWSMSLPQVLSRSQRDPSSLLRGHTFYIFRQTEPSRDVLTRVIEAAGGSVEHATSKTDARVLASDQSHVIGSAADQNAIHALQSHYTKTHGSPLVVYTAEVVLAGVLRQQMDWSSTYQLSAT